MIPYVAIVGRPNVGKSSLFNSLVGKQVSIVENIPGVTRDRVYADCDWCGNKFTLIDTGGLELKSEDIMWQNIKEQVELAIGVAQCIIYVVDGKTGLTTDDEHIGSYLRKCKVPVVLAVNKIDNIEQDNSYDFYTLGFGTPIAVSASQGKGLGELLDEVILRIKKTEDDFSDPGLKIALVGKPNAGKSSIVNKLLKEDKLIVSDIAGTTRDAIDSKLTINNKEYTLIDTAGMRKKKQINVDLEKYSVSRSLLAIKRADVICIVVDGTEGLTDQDVKIIGHVFNEGKPFLIIINKWDLKVKETDTSKKIEDEIKEKIKFMTEIKTLFISAKTGQRVDKIIPLCEKLNENANRRVKTGLLNEVIFDSTRINEPPMKNGKKLKIFYSSQVATVPPTFVIKVNDPELVHFSYERYLENVLRKNFEFEGTPIKIYFRKNKDE
jgi:ribosome-associated GTPase engA